MRSRRPWTRCEAEPVRSPVVPRFALVRLLGSRPMTEVASVLYGREDIRRRVEELGRADHRGLRGAGTRPHLGAQRRHGVPRGPDAPAHLSRSRSTSSPSAAYGDAEESLGRVQILLDLDVDLTGRDVLLVEDIVDTGLTLSYLLSVLRARGPAWIEVCALLDKAVRRIAPLFRPVCRLRLPGPFRRGLRARFRRALSQPRRTSSRSTTSRPCAPIPDALVPPRSAAP